MLYADYDYKIECEYKPIYYSQYDENITTIPGIKIYGNVTKIYKFDSIKSGYYVYIINGTSIGVFINDAENVILAKRISNNLYKIVTKTS